MRAIRILVILLPLLIAVPFAAFCAADQAQAKADWTKDLSGLDKIRLSDKAKELLGKNGFVLLPTDLADITDIYEDMGRGEHPLLITTDAVLHVGHVFFDYLLRILEIEQLYAKAEALTDAMLALSAEQYKQAKDPEVKEAARLNLGFFAVAKSCFSPGYKAGNGLDELVKKELDLIDAHKGIFVRPLLPYVQNPSLPEKGYAFEDYSQYIPRGHYTRNEQFKKYFKALMWFGRLHFELAGTKSGGSDEDKRRMTLQALLMTDALAGKADVLLLWRQIYEPTVYFVGKTDDLNVDDYLGLAKEAFPGAGVERFANKEAQAKFMERAAKLRPPKILSGPGGGAGSNIGFRFMGQRFIPDSHMFQELVYGASGLTDKKPSFQYTGAGKPFTMEVLPVVGKARAFPRGLDVLAVLGSKRASEILRQEGDADYTGFDAQQAALTKLYAATTPQEWRQNLYWRWLFALLPLLEAPKTANQPFLASPAWIDKNLQTALGSWAELRHDTILYAKQSYTGIPKSMPFMAPEKPYGYVEPAPEVYGRLAEMFKDLRQQLETLGIRVEGIPQKLTQFETLLAQLKELSEKELKGQALSDEEYTQISRFGWALKGLMTFPPKLMASIASDADSRMDAIADVHTDPNTGQVLEVAVGSPALIVARVRDERGYRLCRGGAFSFYEFKQPMNNRLTDEAWQQMGAAKKRPAQAPWLRPLSE